MTDSNPPAVTLTKFQLKTLRWIHLFRSDTPTVMRSLAFNWFSWVSLLGLVVVGLLLTTAKDFAALGWWTVGMGVGAFCRDIGRYLGLSRAWPLWQGIIDWGKVSGLMEANQKRGS